MSDKSLIEPEVFFILLLFVGLSPIITFWLDKGHYNILNFSENELIIAPLGLLGGIATICFLMYIIFKISHWIQKLLMQRRISRLTQKEEAIKQNQQNNLTVLRREMQKLSLEAKPLLNSENTQENKQKLEKNIEEFLQPKYNNLDLHEERIKLMQPIADKIQQITFYLQSKEKEILEKKEQIKKNLEIEKGYFKKAPLNENQLKVLSEEGFVEEKCVGLDDKSTYAYLLKPRANESVQHFFLTRTVADHIKSLEIKIETPNSVEPDIIFEINGAKWAIEVETGKYLKYKPDKFQNKVQNLNTKYGNNWLFLVTHRDLIAKYKEYNPRTYHRHQIKEVIRHIIQTSSINIEKS